MAPHKSRAGSLQVWPRKRSDRMLPSVNWSPVKGNGLLGFIGYKVSMTSVYAKDVTNDSMTKGKKIIVPATIIECPEMKIFSVRFYKNTKVMKEIIVGFDDEMKSKVKKPKQMPKFEIPADFDDLRVIVYTEVKKTSLKKSPDMLEIAIGGTKEDKIKFVQEKIGKAISVSDVLKDGLVDVRAVSAGKGLQGPVKRFGISFKSHKSEKGVRRAGNLGPWHPARVTFRTSMSGQLGFFSRIHYNNLIIKTGKISEKDINKVNGFHNYGKIKTDYIIVRGSIPGPETRPVIMTPSIRPTKYQNKKKFEFLDLR